MAESDWPRISNQVFLASPVSTVSRPAAFSVRVPACSHDARGAATHATISGDNWNGCSHHSRSASAPAPVDAATSESGPLTACQCDSRPLVGHGFEDLRQALAPLAEEQLHILRCVQRNGLVFVRAHAVNMPREAGHCSDRWLRSRRMACDFNCEMRDSCRLTTWAISRSVSSSW